MTHIVGLHLDDETILLADTAVSSSQKRSLHFTTSVGEAPCEPGEDCEFYVAEGASKIWNAGMLAIAFTGDLRAAEAFIDVVREVQTRKPELSEKDLLKVALTSVMPLSTKLGFIAGTPAGMIYLDPHFPERGLNVRRNGVQQFGSAATPARVNAFDGASAAFLAGLDAQPIMAALTGSMMLHNMFNASMHLGVGGICHGVVVRTNGVERQKPTVYAFVSKNNPTRISDFIWSASVREHNVWYSSITGGLRIICKDEEEIHNDHRRAEILTEVEQAFRNPVENFVVFSSEFARLILFDTRGVPGIDTVPFTVHLPFKNLQLNNWNLEIYLDSRALEFLFGARPQQPIVEVQFRPSNLFPPKPRTKKTPV